MRANTKFSNMLTNFTVLIKMKKQNCALKRTRAEEVCKTEYLFALHWPVNRGGHRKNERCV